MSPQRCGHEKGWRHEMSDAHALEAAKPRDTSGPGSSSDAMSFRRKIGIKVFQLSGIRRIHIIGCSRSGTTMLHLAMVRFADTMLADGESDVAYPNLLERIRCGLRAASSGRPLHYVTKRNFAWFTPENTRRLVAHVRCENMALINLVRDPRDVMLSQYRGSLSEAEGRRYVSPEHWYGSILASDEISAALHDYPAKVTLRYEDVIREASRTETAIATAFGLRTNSQALSIDRVKDNFDRLGVQFDSREIEALGNVRNMDPASIGRWKELGLPPSIAQASQAIRDRLASFCAEHGYD
jgi:hypothetical protein